MSVDDSRTVPDRPHGEEAVPADYTQYVRHKPRSERAWRQWCAFIYPRVYYSIYRMTGGDRERADEITQETFARFLRYRALDRVKTDSDSIGYLVRTAKRVNLDLMRKLSMRRSILEAMMHEQALDRTEEMTNALDLDRLMSRLIEPDRQLIQWLIAGNSVGEIAEILGISYNAAATRIHRAKARMKKFSEGA